MKRKTLDLPGSFKPETSKKVSDCKEGLEGICADCQIGNALRTTNVWQDFLQERVLQQYKMGTTVFSEGTIVGFVFLLFDGLIKLSIKDGAGRSRVLAITSATQSPCTILDPLSLDRAIHSYTCETLSDCSVFCLPKPRFLWFMKEEYTLAQLAFTAISDELEKSLNRFKREVNHSGRERFAHLLISLLEIQVKSHGRKSKIIIPLRRQEFSSMIGVTRETFSRLLRGFTQSGIISLTEDGIVIRKPDQLEKIASRVMALS